MLLSFRPANGLRIIGGRNAINNELAVLNATIKLKTVVAAIIKSLDFACGPREACTGPLNPSPLPVKTYQAPHVQSTQSLQYFLRFTRTGLSNKCLLGIVWLLKLNNKIVKENKFPNHYIIKPVNKR